MRAKLKTEAHQSMYLEQDKLIGARIPGTKSTSEENPDPASQI